MSEAFLNVVNMSISAGWLVLAVLALRLVLKKAPRWVNVLLWGIVAVRLIWPFSIESALSLIPSAETISPGALLETPEINTGFPAINHAINPVLQGSVSMIAPEKGISTFKLLLQTASVVWVIGALSLLAYAAWSYLRLRQQVRIATILRENIYQCVTVDSPFVLGLLRPRIYLPYDMDEQSLSHVVAHEQAHIRRHDHWWKPLGFLLLTVHWFNPLMWLAYVLLCRDIELACDEKVIGSLGKEQRADYTQALVSCSVNRLRVAACPVAFGEVGVKERVKNVMNYQKPRFWIMVLAVVVCAAVAVCFLTNPVTSVRNPWVQEYVPGAEGIRGNVDRERYESISPDFAIGADQYGRAVFKDPHQAFDTFRIVCKDAIRVVQKEHNLPPLSEVTYPVYKTYGWQTDSDAVDTSFVTAFLDLYENSFTKEVPPPVDPPATKQEPEVTVWFDYLEHPEQMQWDGTLEINLPAFPDVTFRWYPEKIEAVTENGITPLYTGMPIWNTFFCDLTGDGLPELCSTISFGSGMIDDHIVIYDYAEGVSYELWDRGFFDYTLWRNDDDGQLYVEKRTYPGRGIGGIVASGRLVFRDGGFQILGEVTTPSITEIVDPTKDATFAYDAAMERFYEDSRNVYYFGGIYSQYVIVRYTDGTSEAISAALESGRATLADLDRFGIRYWAEPKADPLEDAISQAILAHYASGEPDGLIHAESHVVLASEGMSGTPVFDAGTTSKKVTVYLLVYHGKYSTYGRALEQVGGSYGPAAITFAVSESGTYTLEEYWVPRDGGYYDDDIRSRFPGVSADDALNDQAYLEGLKEENYQKALAYLNSTASVDERIEALLAEIQTSPAHSSNPGEYIRDHEAEYKELVGYGEFTLRYCFTAFLQGGQTDLRSHIMALACQDIVQVMGEPLIPLENIVLTGQDWFDGFYGYAQVLAKNHSAEELQKHYPVTFLLLQMAGLLH